MDITQWYQWKFGVSAVFLQVLPPEPEGWFEWWMVPVFLALYAVVAGGAYAINKRNGDTSTESDIVWSGLWAVVAWPSMGHWIVNKFITSRERARAARERAKCGA
jgi:hypothetical protein